MVVHRRVNVGHLNSDTGVHAVGHDSHARVIGFVV